MSSDKYRVAWTSRDVIPCRENGVDCPDRHPGCQDTCERMKAAKAKNEARKAVEREKRRNEGMANEYAASKVTRCAGKKLAQR